MDAAKEPKEPKESNEPPAKRARPRSEDQDVIDRGRCRLGFCGGLTVKELAKKVSTDTVTDTTWSSCEIECSELVHNLKEEDCEEASELATLLHDSSAAFMAAVAANRNAAPLAVAAMEGFERVEQYWLKKAANVPNRHEVYAKAFWRKGPA